MTENVEKPPAIPTVSANLSTYTPHHPVPAIFKHVKADSELLHHMDGAPSVPKFRFQLTFSAVPAHDPLVCFQGSHYFPV